MHVQNKYLKYFENKLTIYTFRMLAIINCVLWLFFFIQMNDSDLIEVLQVTVLVYAMSTPCTHNNYKHT